MEDVNLLVRRVGTAYIKEAAVGQHLRGEIIKVRVFKQGRHLYGFGVELLQAKRTQRDKLAAFISSHTGGLEDDFCFLARHPTRGSVEGIALSQFLVTAFAS